MARAAVALAILLCAGLAACAATPHAPAKPDAPPPDAGAPPEQADDCGELGMELAEVQREILCILLHRAGVPPTFTVRSAYWPWRKDTLLAVVEGGEVPERSGLGSKRFRVFAFDLSGEQPRLLAASDPQGIELAKDDVAGFGDLEKYRLDQTEHAVAVTAVRARRYTGGDARLERLFVFRFRAKSLEPVLQTVLGYSVDIAGGGVRETLEASATIEIGDAMTGGHFDWLKRTTDASVRLVWRGLRYEMDGEDPLSEERDAEIFRP